MCQPNKQSRLRGYADCEIWNGVSWSDGTTGKVCPPGLIRSDEDNPMYNEMHAVLRKSIRASAIRTPKGSISIADKNYAGVLVGGLSVSAWKEKYKEAWKLTHGISEVEVIPELEFPGLGPVVEPPAWTPRPDIKRQGGERPMGTPDAKARHEQELRKRVENAFPGMTLKQSSRGDFEKGSDIRVYAADDIKCENVLFYVEGKRSVRDFLTPPQSDQVRKAFEEGKPYLLIVPEGHRYLTPDDLEPSGQTRLKG